MSDSPQNRTDGTGMARDNDKGTVIAGINVIDGLFETLRLSRISLSQHGIPQLIVLSKSSLDAKLWVALLEIRLAPTSVAGVSADCFAKLLFDDGLELLVSWEVQSLICTLGCFDTSGQGTRVVAVRSGNSCVFQSVGPESMRDVCLVDTSAGQLGIGPRGRSVAILESPVALNE